MTPDAPGASARPSTAPPCCLGPAPATSSATIDAPDMAPACAPGPPGAPRVAFDAALCAERYRSSLARASPCSPTGPAESSRSGRAWAHRASDGLRQWRRAHRLFMDMGVDLETARLDQVGSCLAALSAAGELDRAALAARARVATDPECASAGGWLHTAATAHPILDGSCLHARGLSLVPVLRHLRREGVRWREVAGMAALGADAPVIESGRPTGTARNYPTDPDERAQLTSLIARDITNGWLAPVPPDLDTPVLRRNAPLSVVPKSDGSSRMVVDDTAAKVLDASGTPVGVNRRMDTSSLRFPDAGLASDAAALVQAAGPGALIGSADISKAYRRIGNSPASQGLLVVRDLEGRAFFTQTAGMGSSHSALALSTVTRAIGEAVSSADDACMFYADDALLVYTDPDTRLPARLASVCSDLGMPINPAKSDSSLSDSAEWCGLRILAARGSVPASVEMKPSTKASVLAALAAVAPCSPIDLKGASKLLGRLAWFARLAPPLRAWARRLWASFAPLRDGRIPSARWTSAAASGARSLARLLEAHGTVRASLVALSASDGDPYPDRVLITDACSSGGGLVDVNMASTVNGTRPDGSFGLVHDTLALHCAWPVPIPASVSSELAMATIAVERHCALHPGSSVHLLSDSVSAVCAAKTFKTGPSAAFADGLLERLASAVLASHTRLSSSHIAGVRNGATDALSRAGPQAELTPSWPSAMTEAGTACSRFSRTRADCSLPCSPRTLRLSLELDASGNPIAPRFVPSSGPAPAGPSPGSSPCTTAVAPSTARLPCGTGSASPSRPGRPSPTPVA